MFSRTERCTCVGKQGGLQEVFETTLSSNSGTLTHKYQDGIKLLNEVAEPLPVMFSCMFVVPPPEATSLAQCWTREPSGIQSLFSFVFGTDDPTLRC